MIRTHVNALLLLSLALLLGAPGAARAAESYDNCTGFISTIPAVITTSGTWCLKQDLSTALTGITAITINTNNVTIDCNDFKLGGLSGGVGTASIGIYASNRLNATVRHCNIRGFLQGVDFVGASGGGHVIEDNRFDSNTFAGMWVEGDGSMIRHNRVYGSGGTTLTGSYQFFQYGINAVYNVDILDNTIYGVTASIGSGTNVYGIHTSNNSSGSISDNRVRALQADVGNGGVSAAVWNSVAGRLTMRNNDVADNASLGGVGLHCTNGNGQAGGNILNGFVTGIDLCSDIGGNVIAP